MIKLDFDSLPLLNRFRIQIPAGSALFKQNDKGDTLYILLEGSVRLLQKTASDEKTIAVLEAGAVLGEFSLNSTAAQRRSFTALAQTDTIALELAPRSQKALFEKHPELEQQILQALGAPLANAA